MANKAISELPQAENVNNQDLFVLEQGGLAKKLPAETFITEQGIINALAEALDGHGGIQSVTLSSVSGRIRTYRITFTDQSATTFQVYDGTSIDRISRTSSSGLDDVYTIFLSDGTTTFFTVHNGADGTVSEAMLNDALKDKAPAITETTESGAIANFTDGADDMPVVHLTANIEPVQDLPYGDPYPAGGGKNLYSILIGADTFQINAGATFSNVDGTLKIEMATANSSGVYATSLSVIKPLIMSLSGEYTLSFDIKASQSGAVICGAESLTSTPITATTSWQRFSLTSTYATPNTTFICYNRSGNAMTVEVKNLQICLSSATDPTVYSPYSNICPITGWTGVNVTRTGKNLIPNLKAQDTANRVRLGESTTGNGNPFKAGKYKISVGVTSGIAYSIFWRTYKNGVHGSVNNSANIVLTEDTNVKIWLFADNPGISVNNVEWFQVELGSTATAYEPYITPATASLSWQTEAGTVYGGTIDVATGLLTVDRAYVDMGTLTWRKLTESHGVNFFSDTIQNDIKASTGISIPQNIICSNYSTVSWSDFTLSTDFCIAQVTKQIRVRDSSLSSGDATAFKTAMSGVQLVYELATPQTYQLTPQEVKTLLGTNNVWTDTGNVSVTYAADTKLYIEKLTMPTEDDLVANQAITSGKYFMIGNSLYLALANIASGAQITIGTNAQRVSLADALNTINS